MPKEYDAPVIPLTRRQDLSGDHSKGALDGWTAHDPLADLFTMPDELVELLRFPIWGTPSYSSNTNGSMKVTFVVPKEFKEAVIQLNDRPGLVLWCTILVPPAIEEAGNGS